MRSKKAGRAGIGLALALGTILAPAGAAPAPAAEYVMETHPVPISIERERVRSALLMQFEIERYGVPLEAFGKRPLDGSEKAFRDFMAALRAGDAVALAALRPAESRAQAQALVKAFREGFGQLDDVVVVGRVRVPDGLMYVWEWKSPMKGLVRRAFTVTGGDARPTHVELVFSGRPLETLLLDVLQHEAIEPARYAATDARPRYRHGFAPSSSAPALLFDGAPLAGTPLLPEAPGAAVARASGALGSALDASRAAYEALSAGDLERYPEFFTDKSREKLRAWMKGLTPAELQSYRVTMTRPRHVHFVLEANPVALVFYTWGDERQVRYDYLVKDVGAYKLTNVSFEGFLDDVLRQPALWPADVDAFRKHVLGVTNSK